MVSKLQQNAPKLDASAFRIPKQTPPENGFFETPREQLISAENRLINASNDTERISAITDIGVIYQQNWGSQPFPFSHEDTRNAISVIFNHALKEGFSENVRRTAMSQLCTDILLYTNGTAHAEDLDIFLPTMLGVVRSSSYAPETRVAILTSIRFLTIIFTQKFFVQSDENLNQLFSCLEDVMRQPGVDAQLADITSQIIENIARGHNMDVNRLFPRVARMVALMDSITAIFPSNESILLSTTSAFVWVCSFAFSQKRYDILNSSNIQNLASASYSYSTSGSGDPDLRLQSTEALFGMAILNSSKLTPQQIQMLGIDTSTSLKIRTEAESVGHMSLETMSKLAINNPNSGIITSLYNNYNITQFNSGYRVDILENMFHNVHSKTGKPIVFEIFTRKTDGVPFGSGYSPPDLAKFDVRYIEAKDENEALSYMKKVAGNLGIKPFSEDQNGEKFSVFGVHGHGSEDRIGLGYRPEIGEGEKYYLDISDKDLAKEMGEYFMWKKADGVVFHATAYFCSCGTAQQTTLSSNVAETWAEAGGFRLFGATLPTGYVTLVFGEEDGAWTVTNVRFNDPVYPSPRNSYDYRNVLSLNADLQLKQDDLSVKIVFNYPENPPPGYVFEGYDIERSSDGGQTFGRVALLPPGTKAFTDNSIPIGDFVYRLKQRWSRQAPGTTDGSKDYGFSISKNASITMNPVQVPTEFVLGQNYPNPFNSSTTIKYYLPKSGTITIKTYDAAGREVKTSSPSSKQLAGWHEQNIDMSGLSSGAYFSVASFTDSNEKEVSKTVKMMLVK